MRQEGLLGKLRAGRSEVAQLPEVNITSQFAKVETVTKLLPTDGQEEEDSGIYTLSIINMQFCIMVP